MIRYFFLTFNAKRGLSVQPVQVYAKRFLNKLLTILETEEQ